MKRRLSASIDEELLAAAEAAVREGYAPSMSALVEDAMREAMAGQRRAAAAKELFDDIDAERGHTLTDDEVRRSVAELRANALRPNGPEAKAARTAARRAA